MVSGKCEIYNYKAGKGDCIRLYYTGESGKNRNIIFDSGMTRFGPTFRKICAEIESRQECIDALVITHVDADHLGGLLQNLRNRVHLPITEVWMNHGTYNDGDVKLSVRQCDEVYTLLTKAGINVKERIYVGSLQREGIQR